MQKSPVADTARTRWWGAILVTSLVFLCSCRSTNRIQPLSPADSIKIVDENELHRDAMDKFFSQDEASPFRRDSTIAYNGLHWYPIDPHFAVHSRLHRYDRPETVVVLGTKGEERRQLKYGYFAFELPTPEGTLREIRLNVYKFTPYDQQRYALYKNHLSIWFTDLTTGKETYEVGRYIELGEEERNPDFVYSIDFNKAFNPYCAYSPLYSCAIPREEDHLSIPITAGEMKYH